MSLGKSIIIFRFLLLIRFYIRFHIIKSKNRVFFLQFISITYSSQQYEKSILILKENNLLKFEYNNQKISFLKRLMFKKRAAKQQNILNLNQSKAQQRSEQKQNQNLQAKQQHQEILSRQQPQKKIKLDVPKNVIASSTSQNKQQKQQQLHKQFKSLNYSTSERVPGQSIETKQIEQLMLQQQLAKKRYMDNVNSTKQVKQGKVDTKVYRGMNNYANYALTQDQIVNTEQKFRKRQGPSRINSTIRNTCRFDYNFGLCKDWHDSGYCPFGDSCIYLHDRSNYKTGWEQERDFERAEKQRWRRINNPDIAQKQQIQESLKSIQKFKVSEACQNCKKQFKSPVQVQCGHIFCISCAASMSKCVVCKKSLGGIMNNAQKKMQKMKETYEQLKAKILKQHQQSKVKRKKYDDLQSQNVFAE